MGKTYKRRLTKDTSTTVDPFIDELLSRDDSNTEEKEKEREERSPSPTPTIPILDNDLQIATVLFTLLFLAISLFIFTTNV